MAGLKCVRVGMWLREVGRYAGGPPTKCYMHTNANEIIFVCVDNIGLGVNIVALFYDIIVFAKGALPKGERLFKYPFETHLTKKVTASELPAIACISVMHCLCVSHCLLVYSSLRHVAYYAARCLFLGFEVVL